MLDWGPERRLTGGKDDHDFYSVAYMNTTMLGYRR